MQIFNYFLQHSLFSHQHYQSTITAATATTTVSTTTTTTTITNSTTTKHYLTPLICIVQCCQHIWSQNFITSMLQEQLGIRLILILFMQTAMKHKKDNKKSSRSQIVRFRPLEYSCILKNHTDEWAATSIMS